MFWLIAPLSAAAGHAAWATMVGAAALQGAAIVALARIAWIRGRLPLVLAALASLALAYAATGSWIMLDPWNPHAAYPFFLLFVFQAWSVAIGDLRRLVGATVVGSLLVQLHVGYAPLVAVVGVWMACVLALDARRSPHELRDWRRPVVVSAALGAAIWLPVLIEQIVNDPGNIVRLTRYFVGGGATEPVVGLGTAAGLVAAEFELPPPWLGGEDVPDPFAGIARPASLWWLIIPVVLAAAGALVARRAGGRAERRLMALAVLLVATSFVVISRVTGEPEPYLFYWRIQVAVLLVMATGWVCWQWRNPYPHGWSARVVAAGLVAAIGWGSGGLALSVVRHEKQTRPFEPVAREVLEQLDERGLPETPVLVRAADEALGGLEGAVINELDRAGVPVRVDRNREIAFGEHRTADPDDVASIWYVTESGALLSHLSALPGANVMARSTPVDPNEEADAIALQRTLEAELETAGRPDLADKLDRSLFAFVASDVPDIDRVAAERLAALNEKVEESGRCRCAIVAFPSELAPPLLVGP